MTEKILDSYNLFTGLEEEEASNLKNQLDKFEYHNLFIL